MAQKFVHLHLHSEYSLLDGLTKTQKLIKKVKENGMDAVALTDHGALYGAVEFYKAAQKEGVKPIVGLEAYTTPGDHKDRPERSKMQNHHLVLLAKNEQGYKDLMEISSTAHIEGYYYRPRISRKLLAKYAKNLVCTSACPAGELASYLIDDDYEGAKKIAKWFLDVFDEDYYLEIQNHLNDTHIHKDQPQEIREELQKMTEIEKKIRDGVLRLSGDLGIPIVATNDAHYLNKEDAEAQDVLVCVATGKQVTDIKRIRFIDSPEYYVKTPSEMSELFKDFPDAVSNTAKVADKCNLEISTLGKWFFPEYKVPDDIPPDEYLHTLAYKRLEERFKKVTKELKERLDYELNIINTKGYATYFLIMMDMVNWANEQGIITNTRGSAAGSLVSYVLGITTVDPIKYYLPFERFLNPYRPSPPDIDLDVSDNHREEVIKYITDRYGKDKVAQICTFGRMLARASVRDIARVLGYPYATGDRISKLIPPPKQGFPVSVDRAIELNPELKKFYDSDEDAKKILDLARQVEGSARHISVHAAGVVVARTKLTDFTPIQKEPSGDKIITQYEFHNCEEVGLIKFDVLGIRNLSILGAAVDIVEKLGGVRVDLRKIPLDDKKTFEMLGRGETMGVFQMGSSGMTKWLIELKPERIEDLMVMVALYRPGPMQTIPEYIERKRDTSKVKFLDPRMKKFLGPSYGLIVYQDDLLFCALDLAGYTWEEADKFRKAVGKKIPEEMAAQKEKFFAGVVANGQTKDFAEMLWKLFEPFQSYGFNKAHAASYGMVAYQTAYMKANYPVEYMCALLSAESNDTDKVAEAIAECRRMNIEVLAPDINESDIGFTIVDNEKSLNGKAIRFGLNAIKNVGKAAIEAILEVRNEAKFVSFADFLARVDGRRVNKKVLESLIKVGAMDMYGKRAALLSVMDDIRNKVSKPTGFSNQQGLFTTDEIKSSMKIDTTESMSQIQEFSDTELQSLERQLLGFSLSAMPMEELLGDLYPLATHKIADLATLEPSRTKEIRVAAVVSDVRIVVTRTSGQEMAFVKVSDDSGAVDLVVFPKVFQSVKTLLIENQPLLISGKVDSRDDSPSLIVDTIKTKDSLGEGSDVLFVRIPKLATVETLRELKNILLENPGNQQVTLFFEGYREKKIDLPIRISWSETLAHKIADLLSGRKHLED